MQLPAGDVAAKLIGWMRDHPEAVPRDQWNTRQCAAKCRPHWCFSVILPTYLVEIGRLARRTMLWDLIAIFAASVRPSLFLASLRPLPTLMSG
jgi:hypothetical protein